ERADRHIGHQLVADDGGELLAQRFNVALGASRARSEIGQLPVGVPPQTGRADLDPFPSAKLPDTFEERALEERGLKMDVLIDPFFVDRARNALIAEQRLDLAGEGDAVAVVVVIQLFDAERIAGEGKSPAAAVPEGGGENSGHFREAFHAALLEKVEEC